MWQLDRWTDLLPLVGFVAATVLLWRLRPPPPPATDPSVRSACAVIIPARNESASIVAAVTSVLAQLQPGDELVVVDDDSDDDTAQLAAVAGARVVPAGAKAPGEFGKCVACASGSAATSAPTLVFMDADVTVHGDLLNRVLTQCERLQPDELISVQPFHRMMAAHERLSLFGNLTSALGAAAFGPWAPRSLTAMAFGPLLVIPRPTYDRVGGHRAIVHEHLEDIAMARLIGRARCYAGRDQVSFRMYPEGWRQVVGGWVRTMWPGRAATPWWMQLVLGAWMAALLGGPTAWWAWYPIGAAHIWWAARRVGNYGPVSALAYPLLAVAFLAMFVRSALTRDRRWRGRSIA
jgi:4,4'-diaponeurosporenoate glycosyltransferase